MIKYKNNINVGTGSVGYEADATSAAPQDSVDGEKIVKSEGRTVKWNQLVQNGDFALAEAPIVAGVTPSLSNATSLYSNGEVQLTSTTASIASKGLVASSVGLIVGHKCYFSSEFFMVTNTANAGCFFGVTKSNGAAFGDCVCYDSNHWSKKSYIVEIPSDAVRTSLRLDNKAAVGDYLKARNLQVIDLTLMFGSGNEPATVAEFESWLSENMVEQDYYAYDAGSLVPVTVKGVKRDVGGTTVTNPMPVTTLKDDNDVVMFPDGLKSAGSVKDEIDWEHGVAVKRVGAVDLGDFIYARSSNNEGTIYYFNKSTSDIPDFKLDDNQPLTNVKYAIAPPAFSGIFNNADKTISLRSGTAAVLFIRDDSYTDATAFKTAVTGQKLYYELATPITYHFATHADLKKRIVKIGESVEVDGIEGETVVWNQMVENGDFSNGISSWVLRHGNSTALSTSDGLELVCTSNTSSYPQIRTQDECFIAEHKYYITLTAKKNNCPITGIRFRQTNSGWVTAQSTELIIEVSQTYTKAETIITAVDDYEYFGLLAINATNDDDNRWYVKDVQVIDLTKMFGSGNEPSTVADFEAWLSAHGGIKDYYPYCAGELKDKEEGNVRGVTQNPYKSITRSVDLTTLTGKVDGAGEDVVMFPDGMKQAGSVKDEIFVEGGVVKAVKRVGTVDLGELTWALRSNYADSGDILVAIGNVMVVGVTGRTVISCDGLKALPNAKRGDITESSYICVEPDYRTINARITDHTLTAEQVKVSLAGIHANYELASPVTYVVNIQGMEMAEVKKVMVGTQEVWEKP